MAATATRMIEQLFSWLKANQCIDRRKDPGSPIASAADKGGLEGRPAPPPVTLSIMHKDGPMGSPSSVPVAKSISHEDKPKAKLPSFDVSVKASLSGFLQLQDKFSSFLSQGETEQVEIQPGMTPIAIIKSSGEVTSSQTRMPATAAAQPAACVVRSVHSASRNGARLR